MRGPIGLNNMSLTRHLAERGLGIALLPVHLAQASIQAGELEVVLPRATLPGLSVYAVTTSRLQPAPVQAFVEFVAERLRPDRA